MHINKRKCFVLWRKPKEEAAAIIMTDELDERSYKKYKDKLLDIFDVVVDSEEIIYYRIDELEPVFSEQELQEIKKYRTKISFFFWKEPPKGTGESGAIILPLDKRALDSYITFQPVLLEIFDATTDSEETLYYKVERLDI